VVISAKSEISHRRHSIRCCLIDETPSLSGLSMPRRNLVRPRSSCWSARSIELRHRLVPVRPQPRSPTLGAHTAPRVGCPLSRGYGGVDRHREVRRRYRWDTECGGAPAVGDDAKPRHVTRNGTAPDHHAAGASSSRTLAGIRAAVSGSSSVTRRSATGAKAHAVAVDRYRNGGRALRRSWLASRAGATIPRSARPVGTTSHSGMGTRTGPTTGSAARIPETGRP
jgi:hypothetical protein